MKEILSLLILPVLGCGLISAAQSPDVTVKKDGDMIVKEYKMKGHNIVTGRKALRHNARTRSEEETLYPLTVEMLDGDMENIHGKDVAVVSRENGFIYGWEMDEEEWEPIMDAPIMLPAGTYDIIGYYSRWPMTIMIFADGIEVNGEKTITLNASDADKKMLFKPLRPDGEGFRVAKTSEYGNCNTVNLYYYINGASKDAYGIFWGMKGEFAEPDDEITEMAPELIDGFLSNGSSVFTVGWSAIGLDYEYGNVGTAMESSIEEGHEWSNSIENYMEFNVDYALSLNQYENGEFIEPRPVMLYTLYWYDKWILLKSDVSLGKISWNWKKNQICNAPDSKFTIGISPYESAFEQDWRIYAIQGPSIRQTGNGLILDSDHPGDGLMSVLNYRTSGGDELYTSNPTACYWQSEPMVFGGTVPVTTLLQSSDMMEYYFYGCLGELRTIDYPASEICAKRNGEIMAESYNDFINMWWSEENIISGDWDITIHNSNLEIDGLRGVNDFSAHFENDNNLWSPAVSGLWFEDGSGLRKDRFAHGADGKMVLYAGDFLYSEAEGEVWWDVKQWFECEKPEKLEVEYAPYGSENYLPFNLKNDAEKDFMPGWGIYYEADLSEVETVSETGWYTLRISISDAHGNSTVQTVAPAFKLEDKTGIDMVEGVDAESDPIYYDLTGMRVSEPKKGNVYIIRNGSKITKAIK